MIQIVIRLLLFSLLGSIYTYANEATTAPKPLYRDPIFDGAADPVLIWNEERQSWWMFYTNRRAKISEEAAGNVKWVHGTAIGIAESMDGGVSWNYLQVAQFDLSSLDIPKNQITLWAPDVIKVEPDHYRMFLTIVPGIFDDWNHQRTIYSFESSDLLHWKNPRKMELSSDKVIDAALMEVSPGNWRMWYNNERDHKSIYYADAVDLEDWVNRGQAVGDQAGEGPKVFRWMNHFWMIMDVWDGLAVYRSEDAENWERMESNLLQEPGTGKDDGVKGGHPDVVVSGNRAYLFYFTHPGRIDSLKGNPYEQRRSSIQVTELFYHQGWIHCDRDQQTAINLKPQGR